MFTPVAFFQNEATSTPVSSFFMPNWRANSWVYDQTQSDTAVPNGGFINPRHYHGTTYSLTGIGSVNNGLTNSHVVNIISYSHANATSAIFINRLSPNSFIIIPSTSGQNPGHYIEGSEDSLVNNIIIHSLFIQATQSSNIKIGQLPTATGAVTFTNAFPDANYAVVASYHRGQSSNSTSAMNGWHISNKTSSGFTYNYGSMNNSNSTLRPGWLAVPYGTDNAYIKCGQGSTQSAQDTFYSFTTPFADSNYIVLITKKGNVSQGTTGILFYNRSTTGFTYSVGSNGYAAIDWVAIKFNQTDYPNGITI